LSAHHREAGQQRCIEEASPSLEQFGARGGAQQADAQAEGHRRPGVGARERDQNPTD
jgi:hypothetical protein